MDYQESYTNPQQLQFHSIDIETAFLSIMMHYPEIAKEVVEEKKLSGSMFLNTSSSALYAIIWDVYEKYGQVDLIMLKDTLELEGEHSACRLDKIGGVSTLAEIYTYVTTPAMVRHYADQLLARKLNRDIRTICNEVTIQTEGNDHTPSEVLDSMADRVVKLSEAIIGEDESHTMRDVFVACHKGYENALKGIDLGLQTGYGKIDRGTGGLQPQELSVICARPSMGKTSFALGMMESIALNQSIPTFFISLEMSKESLGHRLNAAVAKVDMSKLSQGKIDKELMKKVAEVGKLHAQKPLTIDDRGGLTALQIRSKIRREVKKNNIKVVFIDYVQLIKASTKSEGDNANVRISNALKILRQTAKDYNIHVCVLAQLSRAAETLMCGQLNNSMIKDCGEVEQDADLIMMIGKVEEDDDCWKHVKRAIHVTKQRQGATGVFEGYFFMKLYAKFTESI